MIVDPAHPDSGSSGLYDRIGSAVEAEGPVGKAVVASIAAYLIGSLLTAVLFGAGQGLSKRVSKLISVSTLRILSLDRQSLARADIDHREGTVVKLEEIADYIGVDDLQLVLGTLDFSLMRSIEEITNRELGSGQRKLEGAISGVLRKTDGRATVRLIRKGDRLITKLITCDEDGGTPTESQGFVVPTFSVSRDLFRERSTLRARLLEQAETIGLKVERLHAEAEFRAAVAAPLAALVALFATTNPIWLVALLAPFALVAQGIVLLRQSNRALMAALGALSNADELGGVTPVFSRYRAESEALSNAIRVARWPSA